MPPADAELKLVLGSAGASPSHPPVSEFELLQDLRIHIVGNTRHTISLGHH